MTTDAISRPPVAPLRIGALINKSYGDRSFALS